MAQVQGRNTQATVPAHGSTSPDQPVAELVKQLSEQTSRLARQEVELAKAELMTKGKRAGIGAGMFGGAGIFGLYATGALTAAAVLALATAVTAWLAALIVGVALAAVAGVLALQGKTKVQQATPPVPEQATESVKEDVRWAKERAQEGRR
jgi:preprotein translocase subunit SecG